MLLRSRHAGRGDLSDDGSVVRPRHAGGAPTRSAL